MKRRRPSHRVAPGMDFDNLEDRVRSRGVSHVEFDAGDYEFPRALRLPSDITVVGQGVGTRIRLADGANSDLFTNEDWANGNTNIHVQSMHLDGNGAAQSQIVGDGPGQSGVSLVNVSHSSVRHLTIVAPWLHGVDTNRSDANGGVNDEPGCEDIRIHDVHVSGFGDDGITTHWTRGAIISQCSGRDPGRFYTVGGNAIEIDDGSSFVSVVSSQSFRCENGFRVQGHGDAGQGAADSPPAAIGATFSACTAIESEQAGFSAISAGSAPGGGVHGRDLTYVGCRAVDCRDGFAIGGYKSTRIIAPSVHNASRAGIHAYSTHTTAADVDVHAPTFVNVAAQTLDPNSTITITS